MNKTQELAEVAAKMDNSKLIIETEQDNLEAYEIRAELLRKEIAKPEIEAGDWCWFLSAAGNKRIGQFLRKNTETYTDTSHVNWVGCEPIKEPILPKEVGRLGGGNMPEDLNDGDIVHVIYGNGNISTGLAKYRLWDKKLTYRLLMRGDNK